MAKIQAKFNTTDKFNVNGHPGTKVLFVYEYESDVIPRVGESIEFYNYEVNSLWDVHFNISDFRDKKRDPEFKFDEIFEVEEYSQGEYIVEKITHSKFSIELQVKPTDETLSKWNLNNCTANLLECEKKFRNRLEEENIQEKNEKDRKKKGNRFFRWLNS